MKDTKHIIRDFYSVVWAMPQGWDLGSFVFKHGHVAYQIDGDDEQNRMQVTFSSYGQTGDLGARSKGQKSLTYQLQRFLYQTVCLFSQIKYRKHIEQNFILLPGSCPGWDLGVLEGVKNLSLGICDGASSTARSSLFYIYFIIVLHILGKQWWKFT